MLRDSLQKLMQDPSGKGRECKIGNIINSLDEETAQMLVDALKSDASTMGLVRVMKDEGIPVSREYLGEKRNECFKSESSSRCCLQQVPQEGSKK
jgi:hypothetical protein